jgi:hypothetical protein
MTRAGLALMLAMACTAEPPEVSGGGYGPDAAGGTGGTDAGPPPEIPLLLAPLPDSTVWESVPIHGSGPPDGTVLVDTQSSGSLTVPISSSGNFCVDVPLVDGMNEFTLRSLDEEGTFGTPITAQVSKEGEPPPPPEGNPARNVSMGGTVTTSEDVDGRLANVIDSDWGSMVTLTNNWFNEDWVWVLLDERSRIERVVVVSSESCPMNEYHVMFSDLDAPGDPTSDNSNWTYTEVDVPWAATELIYDAFVTKHIAVRFLSSDCAEWYGRGQHVVGEIQAWTEAGVPPPPPAAPSCFSGGTTTP